MSRDLILVNVAEQPYSDQHRRNQTVFERLLAEGVGFEAGLYVNPPVYAACPATRAAAIRRFVHPFQATSLAQHAMAATPAFVLPFSWRQPIGHLQAAFFAARVRRLLAGQPYCLWVNNPDFGAFAVTQALQLQARRLIVDLSDDFTAFADRDLPGLERRVRALVERADGLLAVNEHVAAKFPHPHSLVFPNATDFDALQRFEPGYRLGDVLPKPLGRKYVGFIGGLHRGRVDEELLEKLIDGLPDAIFLFVGYTNDPVLFRRLGARRNVRIYPPVPYSDLSSVIRSFDVAIVPHLDNEFTRGNDLLKVRDYLACGVPVVSTPSSNMERLAGAVHIRSGCDEFIRAVRGLLADQIRHDPGPGIALAQRESWQQAIPRLVCWLRETLND